MIRVVHIIWLAVFLFQGVNTSWAQKTVYEHPDSFFIIARDLAFNGDYSKSRKICFQILDSFPDYHDAAVLIGKSFAWEQKFDSARFYLKPLVERHPENSDAITALIDVEIWSDELPSALLLLNQEILKKPENLDYLYRRAKIYNLQGDIPKARTELKGILGLNSEHEEARKLLIQIEHSWNSNFISLDYSLETSKNPYPRQLQLSSFEYSKVLKKTTFIAGIHYGNSNINGLSGTQIQFQAYPEIGNRMYAFLNYSHGFKSIYPKNRAAGEMYLSLAKDFEISAGLRYLQFDADSLKTNVYIITGSISKYAGNYWFSLRPYISPKVYGLSQSASLEVRRYFKDSKNFAFALISYGNTPDDPTNNINNLEKYQLSAALLKIGYQDYLTKNLLAQIRSGINMEEYQDGKIHYPFDLFVKLYYLF